MLGTHEIENQILVYPNPSDGLFNINLEGNSSYRILDISGKLIEGGTLGVGLNVIKLDVNPGIYLLHLNGTSGAVTAKKIVVF